ncbi:MAG: DUF928 domain-containing protein [Elainellaceae cyanobacterium]
MKLQPLFVFASIRFLLLAEPTSTLAQALPEETAPVSTSSFNTAQNPVNQVLFRPSRTGRQPATRGAGSRNDRLCPQDALTNSDDATSELPALTALVPDNQEGLTRAERPTIWVYLPETSARQMVLSVREEGFQPHSQRFLAITGEPGIVGIPLAEDAPPLEVGKVYQWAVVLICGDRPNPNDPFVSGWVQRVEPANGVNAPQDALERAVWYGEQGIWYDALTALAEARRSQPTDPALAEIWTNFLTQPSVGLEAIANEPLL